MDWSVIADAGALRAAGLFVAEGRRVVHRVLHDERFEVVDMLASPAAVEALHLPSSAGMRVEVRTPAEMQELTGFNFHRGVLALVRRPPLADLVTLTTSLPAGARLVVCEQLGDADNVGSVFRNARALGASAVLLDDRSVDPLYRKAVRTSSGAVLDVPWTVAPREALRSALSEAGVVTLALTPNATAPALGDLCDGWPESRLAVVVGNEGDGLSDETLRACDYRARIPMAPGADSLNVATALAVALYALGGSRNGRAGEFDPGA